MPKPSKCVQKAQEALIQIADELRKLDGRLAKLTDSLESEPGRVLPGELAGGARCVRTDLLQDAIETLSVLGRQTEEGAAQRRLEAVAAVEQIAAFG